jgi:glycosyltransferase involved in cell wall biosynthesis
MANQDGAAKVALIIPALNEEDVIAELLSRVPPGVFSTVVVADNGSTDRTAELARRSGAKVVYEPERGYGAACLRAMEALRADTEIVVFIQADCSEDPAEAPRLLEPILSGRADMVLGSRVLGAADPRSLLPHQRFGNWLATTLIRLLYRHRYTDLGPFRAIRLEALERLRMSERNYGWTVEMQVKALEHGLRVLEVPVSYHIRLAGKNKVSGSLSASLRAGYKIITTILRLALTGKGSR